MELSYIEFVVAIINETKTGQPIYSKDLANRVAEAYNLNYDKAAANVATALNRILKQNLCDDLRCYQKGIYYRAIKTPFGEKKIDKENLINNKYIKDYEGYESGNLLLNHLGLTTQIPNERIIVTNYAKDCARKDTKLGVTIKPPKTRITKDNKDYFIILDTLNLMDDAPVDVENPYNIVIDFINKHKLKYQKLLAYAKRYYNQNTIMKIADTAVMEVNEYNETS